MSPPTHFGHPYFKVVDNVFGSVEVPQEGVPTEDDDHDDDPFASLGDMRPRMADAQGRMTTGASEISSTLLINS